MTDSRSPTAPDVRTRAVLAQRARHLAERVATESDVGDLEVRLEMAGRHYAVPSRHVREVLSPGPVITLPGRDHRLRGARAVRGGIVAVADLTALGTSTGTADPAECFVVVVDGPAPLGLLAERVTMAEATEHPHAATPSGSITAGVTPDGVTLIDIEALLADPRFSVPGRSPHSRTAIEGTP